MEKVLIKEAMKLYLEKLNDVSFAESQVITNMDTAKRIAVRVNNFKNECKLVCSKEVEYPKNYSELEVHIIYFGLMELRNKLNEEYIELNKKSLHYSQRTLNGEKLMSAIEDRISRSVDKRLICNRLELEFVDLYYKYKNNK